MSSNDNSHPPESLGDRVRSLRLGGLGAGGGFGKLPWVICVLLLASTITFGFQAYSLRTALGKVDDSKAPPKGDKKVAESEDIVLQAKGYIIPAHLILVTPQVGGKVEGLYIEEGKRVDRGEIIAQIETIEYETKWKRALAKHEALRQTWELVKSSYPEEVKRARHDLEEARSDFDRIKDQLTRAERLDVATQSREELIKLKNETAMLSARVKRKNQDLELADLARWRVSSAEQDMEAAKAELEEARWRLDSCTILAPVSGTILTKKAEEGNLVNAAAFSGSTALCEMADLSDLEVDLSIQERDISNIVVGQECRVMPEAFQNNPTFLKLHLKGYDGVVARLMPIADRAKGAIPVRVKVKVPRTEEGVYLKPDMGTIVSFKKMDK